MSDAATATTTRGAIRRSRRRRRARAVTLIEVLITVAIVSVMAGAAIMGVGVAESARLKQSAVMISGAIRVAYGHANATSKTVRLVFDFESRTLSLEESSKGLLLEKNDRAGGAEASTDYERDARAAAEAIAAGPRSPRAQFQPAKAFGFSGNDGKSGKELGNGVRFIQVETAHSEVAEREGRSYLYFWPGGQTERAAIQLAKGPSGDDDAASADVFTILVAPLTGKTEIKKGKFDMARPRNDSEESDREDTGF